ncbi:MAG: MFS transporter [Dehalococcoidia bacterium]
MADSTSAQDAHDPLAAWRVPAFRAFALSRACGATAMTMLQAIVAWQVYAISESALQLGLIGLARFIPALAVSLVGGAVADVYDRRRVIQLAQLAPLLSTVVMLGAIAGGFASLTLLYGIVVVTGLAASFENPARQALLPAIVPRTMFTNAITAHSTVQSIAFISGPAVGGLAIAAGGVGAAWTMHGTFVLLSIAVLFMVPSTKPTGAVGGVSVEAIREGVSFVLHRPVLLGAMTLDMLAVIFGGAKALLPIYAVDILDAGPLGYGILSASLEAGALLMSVVLILRRPPDRTGAWLLGSVAAFGLATIAFGLSRSFPLSVAAYAAVGMADQISVVMRQTTIQLRTPDELRGRVSAVNQVFIGASNQLGGVESGVVAALTSATFAVVSGGFGCLAVVGIIGARIPELRRYRAADDERPVEAVPHEAAPARPAEPTSTP